MNGAGTAGAGAPEDVPDDGVTAVGRAADVGERAAAPARPVESSVRAGAHVVQDERYFVVRVTDNALSRDAWTDLEREVMVEHRWWSLEELSRTEATVWPENLRAMIEAALR